MEPTLDPSSRLTALRLLVDDLLGGPGRRYAVVLLAFVVILLLTREAALVPITVGWSASKRLVEQEQELAQIQKQTAEYSAAAEYFRTPEGQKSVGGLVLKVPDDGERRVVLKPQADKTKQSTAAHIRSWLSNREADANAAMQGRLRVAKRWCYDPPQDTLSQDAPSAATKTRPRLQAPQKQAPAAPASTTKQDAHQQERAGGAGASER